MRATGEGRPAGGSKLLLYDDFRRRRVYWTRPNRLDAA